MSELNVFKIDGRYWIENLIAWRPNDKTFVFVSKDLNCSSLISSELNGNHYSRQQPSRKKRTNRRKRKATPGTPGELSSDLPWELERQRLQILPFFLARAEGQTDVISAVSWALRLLASRPPACNHV
ncbi:hypothetical protein AVEN_9495-1 [Araneus ventricosus]|uniref:Uncharacterized protein n=1 Tax=Araneus ventricosus TaxID=182803 RepID=A0A4Y2R0T0_ARAVE|nr:hypothetical protein AVEN_9495-1 [Araneus ventricosus]